MNIYDAVSAYKAKIENQIEICENNINNAPAENLLIGTGGDRVRLFVLHKAPDGTRKKEYIRQKDERLKALAFKRFSVDALKVLRKNLQAADSFINNYSHCELSDVAVSYPADFQAIIQDYYEFGSTWAENWIASNYEKNSFKLEELIYKTQCGTLVRSKSEVMIMDALSAADLIVLYECKLAINGKSFYPDFTILDPANKRVYYWEHFGMMGNEDYAKSACEKIALYQEAGYYLGENLIVTMESRDSAFSSSQVNQIINHYFG